jgi:antitoxin HigA-1
LAASCARQPLLRHQGLTRLSRDLNVPPNRIHSIVHGTRAITADTALGLAAYFGTTPETWLNLQISYALRKAQRAVGKEIAKAVRRREPEGLRVPNGAGKAL